MVKPAESAAAPKRIEQGDKLPSCIEVATVKTILHLRSTEGLRSVLLVRIAAGLIFFTQGILKYIDPNMGVVRFTRIGFPHPYFTAHFVGTFEVLCGLLLLVGLWTRLVSIPLLIVITTAIATTKIPELFRANQGFWYMVSDARTDFAMFCCLVFLISVGGGSWSLDAKHATADD